MSKTGSNFPDEKHTGGVAVVVNDSKVFVAVKSQMRTSLNLSPYLLYGSK